MKNFLGRPIEKVFGLKSLDREALIYRVLPHFLMEILRKYFRLEVEGIEHVPRRGPAVIAPNHSGYSGFDVFVLIHVLTKDAGRIPRVLAHYFWFLSKTTAIPASKVGFTEATFENGLESLRKKHLTVIFPEGEHGNFKPSSKMYQLQPFKRGFVRMALKTGAPIVPVLVLGAEETHINLTKLKFTKFLRGLVIPLPLNVIPLPARWKIRFLEPIVLPYKPEAADDAELVHEIAADIQEKMQSELRKELKKRDSVYL